MIPMIPNQLKFGMVFMLMIAFAQNLFMLAWTPDINQTYIIFLLAFGFGLSQSIGYGQVRGIFKMETFALIGNSINFSFRSLWFVFFK